MKKNRSHRVFGHPLLYAFILALPGGCCSGTHTGTEVDPAGPKTATKIGKVPPKGKCMGKKGASPAKNGPLGIGNAHSETEKTAEIKDRIAEKVAKRIAEQQAETAIEKEVERAKNQAEIAENQAEIAELAAEMVELAAGMVDMVLGVAKKAEETVSEQLANSNATKEVLDFLVSLVLGAESATEASLRVVKATEKAAEKAVKAAEKAVKAADKAKSALEEATKARTRLEATTKATDAAKEKAAESVERARNAAEKAVKAAVKAADKADVPKQILECSSWYLTSQLIEY